MKLECRGKTGDRKDILRENILTPRGVPPTSSDPVGRSSLTFSCCPGLLGLSRCLSSCPSRTHSRPGFSWKCASALLLPVHYGTAGRASRPPGRGTALSQWRQWTTLHQRGTWEQGLPCRRRGLPQHETTTALPCGAPAGKGAPDAGAHRPPRREGGAAGGVLSREEQLFRLKNDWGSFPDPLTRPFLHCFFRAAG